MTAKLPSPRVIHSCTDFCLNIASWMHSCRGCAKQPKLYTLQSVRDSFFLCLGCCFKSSCGASLATCHFSSTFIKQLEWQYLDAVHKEAYNVKQLLSYWNHYQVSVWERSGHWFEDHQWMMANWVFEKVIWGSSCICAQELLRGKLKKNLKCQSGMVSHWLWHKIWESCPC